MRAYGGHFGPLQAASAAVDHGAQRRRGGGALTCASEAIAGCIVSDEGESREAQEACRLPKSQIKSCQVKSSCETSHLCEEACGQDEAATWRLRRPSSVPRALHAHASDAADGGMAGPGRLCERAAAVTARSGCRVASTSDGQRRTEGAMQRHCGGDVTCAIAVNGAG